MASMPDYGVRAIPANEGGRGNLAGFEATCPECGLRMSNTSRDDLNMDVIDHDKYHRSKESAAHRAGQAYGARRRA